MGRGRNDTCENCIHGEENRDGTYTCKLDKSENDKDNWCKHHESEDD